MSVELQSVLVFMMYTQLTITEHLENGPEIYLLNATPAKLFWWKHTKHCRHLRDWGRD